MFNRFNGLNFNVDAAKNSPQNKKWRTIAICSFLAIAMLIFSIRLVNLQLVNAEHYQGLVNRHTAYRVIIPAPRGEILDRYGRPLARNRQSMNLVFDATYFVLNATRHNDILDLLAVLVKNEEAWRDELPLDMTYPFAFTEDSRAVTTMLERLELRSDALAEDVFSRMVALYALAQFEPQVQRVLMGIRYTASLRDFSISNPFTLAEDISIESASVIREIGTQMPGINVEMVPIREYMYDDLAVHLLGAVGPIPAEQWEDLRALGYAMDDIVGISGIEFAMESYLRGTPGIREVVIDRERNVISNTVVQEAQPGHTIILTIDKNLQREAQNSLAAQVRELSVGEGRAAEAGAVVVNCVNTGDILASATYPTYTMTTYRTNFSSLLEDRRNPLFDRALRGNYPPGSIYKSAVAVMGLQQNIITAHSTFNCQRVWSLYEHQFRCMGLHGHINVSTAISRSCNIFFYEVGYRLGIQHMNDYARLMGFGVQTGAEIIESAGVLAGPATGRTWYPGNTVQAAIGQSDHLFTPLQMAVSTATIANGGRRYQARFVREIKSHNLAETIRSNAPNLLEEIELRPDVITTVKNAMRSASLDGTARRIFAAYPLEVAAKTGTPTITASPGAALRGARNGYSHSAFIAFAPHTNPTIAVAAFIEHGGAGSDAAPLVRDMFDAHFFTEPASDALLSVNSFLQ